MATSQDCFIICGKGGCGCRICLGTILNRAAPEPPSSQHNCDDQKCTNPDYAGAAPPAGHYPLKGLSLPLFQADAKGHQALVRGKYREPILTT
jgi:hypothetical protein